MKARTLLSVALVAPFLAIAPARAASLSDYDVQKAETWADALAICDVTKFLLSDPKLDSEVIIAAIPGGSETPLYRPYFVPPTNFYSQVMKDTFEYVLKARQVTSEAYGAARFKYAKLMISAYRGNLSDKAFLNAQMRTCYALAADASGRAHAVNAKTP